jgi:magnesium transporter
MITYWKNDNGLIKIPAFEPNCWVNVVNPSQQESQYLTEKFSLDPDYITDILDIDELARIDNEDDWLFLIIRIPVHNVTSGLPFYTVPLGVLISQETIITICQGENEVINGLLSYEKNKKFDFVNKFNFFLHLFLRTAYLFLRYLKQINAQTNSLEKDIEKSTQNKELHRLLRMEKCLVFFVTSLKSNELLLAKIRNSRLIKPDQYDEDLLDDVIVENKQAIEMANIYSDILSGMMDAFASVIGNNLNVIMKQLTIITIVLMIPTLISSFFGMNVPNFHEENNYAFYSILLFSFGISGFGVYILKKRNWF